jgi:hypothetical protein
MLGRRVGRIIGHFDERSKIEWEGTLDCGLWTVDCGLCGPWTVDRGTCGLGLGETRELKKLMQNMQNMQNVRNI